MYFKSITNNVDRFLDQRTKRIMACAFEDSNVKAGVDQFPSIKYQQNIVFLISSKLKDLEVMPFFIPCYIADLSLEDICDLIDEPKKFPDETLFVQMIGAHITFKLNSDASVEQEYFSKEMLKDAIIKVLNSLPWYPDDDFEEFLLFKNQYILPIATGAFTVYKSFVNPDQVLNLQRYLAACNIQSKMDQLFWPSALLGVLPNNIGDSTLEDIPKDLFEFGEDAEEELLDFIEEIIGDYVDADNPEAYLYIP